MSFPLPEPISFDLGRGVQTITSLAEAGAVLAQLPPASAKKPAFLKASELIARALALSNDQAIAEATAALKAAFAEEGMERHY
jgi:hypothetical protein